MRIGVIGLSPGNGHPYSFAAIFNGYDEQGIAACPYPRIYKYLRERSATEFGIDEARVTHVWTPDRQESEKIARAARIPEIVENLSMLPNVVDAAIIARDDADSHWPIAQPFLKRGLPVFVDKPLARQMSDLMAFYPFLRSGAAMSCSAMRYAVEMDSVRVSLARVGKVIAGRAICFEDDLFKYGAHLVEGFYGLLGPGALSVRHVGTRDTHVVRVRFASGAQVIFQAIKGSGLLFQWQLFGTHDWVTAEVSDNFSMFRRMLCEFVGMVKTAVPPIPPVEPVEIAKVLIAAERSLAEDGREVSLAEVR